MTGKKYTEFRTQQKKERPFRIIKIGLTRDREELYDRINRRVEIMIEDGLEEEARKVYPYRALNSLNTVGYKEMFKYLDGEWTLPFAIEKNLRLCQKRFAAGRNYNLPSFLCNKMLVRCKLDTHI